MGNNQNELFYAVLRTTVVHNNTHTQCEQFLNLHVGLGLDSVLVVVYRFIILCFCISVDHYIHLLLVFVVLCLVSSVGYQAKRLPRKDNCKMTHSVSIGT